MPRSFGSATGPPAVIVRLGVMLARARFRPLERLQRHLVDLRSALVALAELVDLIGRMTAASAWHSLRLRLIHVNRNGIHVYRNLLPCRASCTRSIPVYRNRRTLATWPTPALRADRVKAAIRSHRRPLGTTARRVDLGCFRLAEPRRHRHATAIGTLRPRHVTSLPVNDYHART